MDHKYHQLVLFPTALIHEPEIPHELIEEQSGEPYEVVTQQQMSRLAALVLFGGFVVFLGGYWIGQIKAREAHDGLLPTQGMSEVGITEIRQEVTETCVRVATYEQAVTLGSGSGSPYEIIPHTSYTVSGAEKTWYEVTILQKGMRNDN